MLDSSHMGEMHLAAIGAAVSGPGAWSRIPSPQDETKTFEVLTHKGKRVYVEGNVMFPAAFGWEV
jgi:hypothetical protein